MSQENLSEAPSDKTKLLSTLPVNKLFSRLATPMVFGMIINGLYNLVDATFVSHFIGSNAMAAVSIAFPLQMIIISLAACISNGSSVLVGQFLGANKIADANGVIGIALRIIAFLSTIIAAISIFYHSSLLQLLEVPVELQASVIDYFMPLALGNSFIFMLSLCSDLLRAQGKMSALFIVILTGAVANIILDTLFIAVLNWGLTAAAIATLLAQLLGCFASIKYFSKEKSKLRLLSRLTLFNCKTVGTIVTYGAPVLIQYAGAAIIIALVNTIIGYSAEEQTPNWIASYGIIGRLNIFMILPLIAMTNATQTIIAYNYGANNKQRVQKALRQGLKAVLIYLSIMASILLIVPEDLLSIFTHDETVISFGVKIARMMFVLLPLAGISSILAAYFQGVDKPRLAIFLVVTKIYLVIIPLLFLIEAQWGYKKLWYAFPSADLVSVALASYFFFNYIKSNERQLAKGTI